MIELAEGRHAVAPRTGVARIDENVGDPMPHPGDTRVSPEHRLRPHAAAVLIAHCTPRRPAARRAA